MKRVKAYYCLFIFFLSILISSCKKEVIDIPVTEIQSSTSYTLSDLFFLDDNVGYACGGERFGIGVLLKTTDGGKTWSEPDSVMPKQSYASYFFNAQSGFVTGFDSWLCLTNDSAKSFSSRWMPAYLPTHDIAFNGLMNGVMVGGAGYDNGTIYTTRDGGQNWAEYRFTQKLECVEWVSDKKVLAGGYGVLFKSDDEGVTWQAHNDVRGDFFKDISFPSASTGYLLGWQGTILKTTDGGNKWTKVQSGNNGFNKRVYLAAMDFLDEQTGAVVGDDGTMFITNNGGAEWKQAKSFTSINLYDVHLFKNRTGIACGEAGKIFLFSL